MATGALDWFSNPGNQGLLALASGLLQAGGPQRFPVSFGQALGQGAEQGIGAFNQARQLNAVQAMREAQMGHIGMQNQLIQQQVTKAQQEAEMTKQLMLGGGVLSKMSPDQLDLVGQKLALTGHPGAATVMNIADKRREQARQAQALQSMQSTPGSPGILGAGVTAESPQGQGLLSQGMTGDPQFDQAALNLTNQALNANASPQMPAQSVTAPATPQAGFMSPLMQSQYVGPAAAQLQQAVNAGAISPKDAIARFEQLIQLHVAQTGQATGRQENIDARAQAAAQSEALRRELAANRPESPVQTFTAADGTFYERKRGGNWEAAVGPEGKPIKGKVARNPMAEQLYKDYAANPQVKQANDLEVRMKPVAQYMVDFAKTGKSINANDAALAKMYLAETSSLGNRAYMMDKKELGALPNLGDRLGNMASSFFAGKDLTDTTRKEMWGYIVSKYRSADAARQQQRAAVTARAKANMVPVDQVFGAQE